MTRILNVAGLALGYLLGQGSFLLASFVLLGREQYGMATAVGLAMTIVTLALFIIDMGGQICLARQQAMSSAVIGDKFKADQADAVVQRALAGMIVLRMLSWLGLLLFLLLFGDALRLFPDPLSRNFTVVGVAGLVFWVFNQTGILDGKKCHGWSGLTASIPWVLTSALIMVGSFGTWPADEFGTLLGLAFAGGALLAVVIQAVLLGSSPIEALYYFRWYELVEAVRTGGGVFLSQLPGQLTGRVQIFFAVLVFPVEISSAFILSRNILNASNNLVYMARRIEFPDLVRHLHRQSLHVYQLLAHQRLSFFCSIALGLIYVLFGALAYSGNLPDVLKGSSCALRFTLDFLPVFVASTLSGALVQALLAIGKPSLLLMTSVISFVVSTLLTWALVFEYGTWAMVTASLAANLIIIAIMMYSLGKRLEE